MKSAYLVAAAVIVAGLFLASCGPNKPRYNGEGGTEAGAWQPTQHWIYDDQLQAAMRDLDQARRETGKIAVRDSAEAPPPDPTAEFLKASLAAERLADSAMSLIDSVDRFRLGSEDRVVFLEQARVLHDQAMAASRAARERRTNDVRRQLDVIAATCISCHTRFRDFTIELAPPRV